MKSAFFNRAQFSHTHKIPQWISLHDTVSSMDISWLFYGNGADTSAYNKKPVNVCARVEKKRRQRQQQRHAFIAKSQWHLCMDMQFGSCWNSLVLALTTQKCIHFPNCTSRKYHFHVDGIAFRITFFLSATVTVSPRCHRACLIFKPKVVEHEGEVRVRETGGEGREIVCVAQFPSEKLLVNCISISIIIQTPALIRRLWLHRTWHGKESARMSARRASERDGCLVYLFNSRSENWRCAKRNVNSRECKNETQIRLFGIVCFWRVRRVKWSEMEGRKWREKNRSFGTPKILLSHIISFSLSLALWWWCWGWSWMWYLCTCMQCNVQNCDEVQTKMATLKLEPTVKS